MKVKVCALLPLAILFVIVCVSADPEFLQGFKGAKINKEQMLKFPSGSVKGHAGFYETVDHVKIKDCPADTAKDCATCKCACGELMEQMFGNETDYSLDCATWCVSNKYCNATY